MYYFLWATVHVFVSTVSEIKVYIGASTTRNIIAVVDYCNSVYLGFIYIPRPVTVFVLSLSISSLR